MLSMVHRLFRTYDPPLSSRPFVGASEELAGKDAGATALSLSRRGMLELESSVLVEEMVAVALPLPSSYHSAF